MFKRCVFGYLMLVAIVMGLIGAAFSYGCLWFIWLKRFGLFGTGWLCSVALVVGVDCLTWGLILIWAFCCYLCLYVLLLDFILFL